MYVVIAVVIDDVLDVGLRYFVCANGGPMTFGRLVFGGISATFACARRASFEGLAVEGVVGEGDDACGLTFSSFSGEIGEGALGRSRGGLLSVEV